MAHKVHPKAYRLKNLNNWFSRGYYEKNSPKYLEEDFRIRDFLAKSARKFSIEKVEIERFSGKLNIIIYSSKPGLIIGRGGEGVEKLRKIIEKEIFNRESADNRASKKKNNKNKQEIRVEIREVKIPWASAKLTAQWIAIQIEKRVPFRRVLKQALAKISEVKEIKGARVEVSGRLNGAEMSRREWLSTGKLPRQTIRAEIDYAKEEAYCSYGIIGVKVWLYKGDKFD